MGDLPRRMAEPHARVKRRGPDPQGAAVLVQLRGSPEPHVMPSPRVLSRRLLESQVLRAAQTTRWLTGIDVGAMKVSCRRRFAASFSR